MTDRELLEAAAKAYWGAEIDDVVSIEWGEQDESILYTHADNQDHNGCDRTYCWNPLTDDGDALRLAVKLNLLDENAGFTWQLAVEMGKTDDRYAATRRAIVLAAAATIPP